METRWFVTMIMVAVLPLCVGEATTAATAVGRLETGQDSVVRVAVAWPPRGRFRCIGVEPAARISSGAKLEKAGYNSPVVWGDKVLLCGGDEKKLAVCCHQAETGKLLWNRSRRRRGRWTPTAIRAGRA